MLLYVVCIQRSKVMALMLDLKFTFYFLYFFDMSYKADFKFYLEIRKNITWRLSQSKGNFLLEKYIFLNSFILISVLDYCVAELKLQ